MSYCQKFQTSSLLPAKKQKTKQNKSITVPASRKLSIFRHHVTLVCVNVDSLKLAFKQNTPTNSSCIQISWKALQHISSLYQVLTGPAHKIPCKIFKMLQWAAEISGVFFFHFAGVFFFCFACSTVLFNPATPAPKGLLASPSTCAFSLRVQSRNQKY